MITRTIKYTASDGTEHDSPQEAAKVSLAETIRRILEMSDLSNEPVADRLARNPEALRDAVNAYFEDLEEHPDVEVGQDPVAWSEMRTRLGFREGVVPGAGYIPAGTPVYGNPNDPTTWRADLPVDHPNYCRPFGTRER